jgi:tetratricopeptide (TPR) repeat protein
MTMSEMQKRFEVVQGYLELSMFADALAELKGIEMEAGPRFEVLALRMTIHRAARQWDEMRKVTAAIQRQQPAQAEAWIWHADATRHSVSLEAAREILIEAEKAFPQNPHIKFQIGCYHCRLGEMEPAEKYVRAAIAIDPRWNRIALSDEDVRELWPRLASDSASGT